MNLGFLIITNFGGNMPVKNDFLCVLGFRDCLIPQRGGMGHQDFEQINYIRYSKHLRASLIIKIFRGALILDFLSWAL